MTALWDKLSALIEKIFDEYDKIWGKQAKKRDAINLLNEPASQKFRDTTWKHVPEDLKKDPDVIRAYEASTERNGDYESKAKSDLTEFAGSVESFLTETLFPDTVTPISDAYAKARAFAIADLGKDVAIGALGLAVETASLGQIDTFTDTWKFVRSKTGFGGIATQVLRAPLEMALMRPLSYHLHNTFRNELPDPMQLWMNVQRRDISEEELVQKYNSSFFGEGKSVSSMRGVWNSINGYAGIPDWVSDLKWQGRYMEPRMRDFMMATGEYLFNDEWLDLTLDRMMVDPRDRNTYKTFLKEKYMKPYRDRIAAQVRNMYKEGYISYDAYYERLTALEIPAKVIHMMASEADYLYHFDYFADLRATWMTAFKNDILNEDQYRGNLRSIMVDTLRIEGEINRAKAARKPKSVAAPKKQTQGVKVTSKPANAMIFLDGTDTGKRSPEVLELDEGQHTISVSATGFHYATYDVQVQAGQFVELYAVLTRIELA